MTDFDGNDSFWNQVQDQPKDGKDGPCEACSRTCPRCQMPEGMHTRAGRIECAWRGFPCETCGQPPHPPGAEGRCDEYAHPSDTLEARRLRQVTPWHRNDPGPFYTWRHCNHRRGGRLQPA